MNPAFYFCFKCMLLALSAAIASLVYHLVSLADYPARLVDCLDAGNRELPGDSDPYITESLWKHRIEVPDFGEV